MNKLLEIRSKIYDFFHGSIDWQNYFFKNENKDRYALYYTSMYLLQDTGEAIFAHMKKNFSESSLIAYIEFWGVMQAIFIQQDAIEQLYCSITNEKFDIDSNSAWKKLRDLRNLCAGHPINQNRNNRVFMGRNFGNYNEITYELWNKTDNKTTHHKFELGKLICQYDIEASGYLRRILENMKNRKF